MVEAVLLSAPPPQPVLPQSGLPIAAQPGAVPPDAPDFAAVMADGRPVPAATMTTPEPALPPTSPQVVAVLLPLAAPPVPQPGQTPPAPLPETASLPLQPAPPVAATPALTATAAPVRAVGIPLPAAYPVADPHTRDEGLEAAESVTNMAETAPLTPPDDISAPAQAEQSVVEVATPPPGAVTAPASVPTPPAATRTPAVQPVADPAPAPAQARATVAAAPRAPLAAPPPERANPPAVDPNAAKSAAPVAPQAPLQGWVTRAEAAPSTASQPAQAAAETDVAAGADALPPALLPLEAPNASQTPVSGERPAPAEVGTTPRGGAAVGQTAPQVGPVPWGIDAAADPQTAPPPRTGGEAMVPAPVAAGDAVLRDPATTEPQPPATRPDRAAALTAEPPDPATIARPESLPPAAWTLTPAPAGRAEAKPAVREAGALRVEAGAGETPPPSPEPLPAPSAQPLQAAAAAPASVPVPPPAALPAPIAAAIEPLPDLGIGGLPTPFSAVSEPVSALGPAPDGPAGTPSGRPVPIESLPALLVAQADGRPAEIHLEPLDLGRLRFDVVADGQEVQVTLAAERSDTADLLRRHAAELEAEFRQAGFVQVTIGFGTWAGSRGQSRTPPGPAATADAPVQAAQAAQILFSPQARAAPGRGLHLRL